MAKSQNEPETVAFTIVLPRKAAERLDILKETGFWGSKRAQVASNIILQQLQELWKSGKLPD